MPLRLSGSPSTRVHGDHENTSRQGEGADVGTWLTALSRCAVVIGTVLIAAAPAAATIVSPGNTVYDGALFTESDRLPRITIYFSEVDHAEVYTLIFDDEVYARIPIHPDDGRRQILTFRVPFGEHDFHVEDEAGRVVDKTYLGHIAIWHIDLRVTASPNPFNPRRDRPVRIRVCYDIRPNAGSDVYTPVKGANYARTNIFEYYRRSEPYRSLSFSLVENDSCKVVARFDGRDDFGTFGESVLDPEKPDWIVEATMRFGPTRRTDYTFITDRYLLERG
jgi:hypothetical protein